MKKRMKSFLSVVVAGFTAISMVGCSYITDALSKIACNNGHQWEDWQRSKTEHWRVCERCDEEERGTHEDSVCDDCAAFKALALGFIEGGDEAHSDFAKEANEWFPAQGKELGFLYDFTTDWGQLNDEVLEGYDLVMFLNNLPWEQGQREAFERYMENGGAWMGFHVCAFTTAAKDWAWYHENFLGSGNFRTNTWNPTSETLKVETHDHFSTENLPETFQSAPNEWYGWELDLTANDDITILLSLDESTFPAGDKEGEMWYEGYFPVAWTNKNYKMVYLNMGHNLMYYNTYEKTSRTFGSETQNQFILDAMFGLTE